MNRRRGGIPIPEYRRTTRASDPALRGYVPALAAPVENANQTVNKVALLLNRAGSSRYNPILSGLGQHVEFKLDERDRLIDAYIYRARPDFGPGYLGSMTPLGGNVFGFDIVHGADTTAGSPLSGATQNFFRVTSRAGAAERFAWVKSYDKDIVVVNGENSLDDALDPVEIVLQIIDATRDWIDCVIGFMPSWRDEFQVGHDRNVTDVEIGNLKSYGGAKFVSFFETGEDEGVGTEVNPVTGAVIENQHVLQVENTEGLKHVTVRFRSKADSLYFVDIPVLLRVVAPTEGVCEPPQSEPCSAVLYKLGDVVPTDPETPDEPSVPGVQIVASDGVTPLDRDLVVITVHGQGVGSLQLRVQKLQWVYDAAALAGAKLEEVGTVDDYLPLVQSGDSPLLGSPYDVAHRLSIAFGVSALNSEDVAFLQVMVLDGNHVSEPILVPGPKARAVQFFLPGGAGGGDPCMY